MLTDAPETVAVIATHYFASQSFAALPEAKQKSYRSIIKQFVARNGNKALAPLQPQHLARLLAKKAALTDVSTANNWLLAIEALCRFGAAWESRRNEVACVAPLRNETPQTEPRRLYVIRGVDSGLFKIGIAYRPESRLRELQVGSPLRLELVSHIAIESRDAERVAHSALASYRSHGEWFDFGPLGDYVAGRVQREASDVDALMAILREMRSVVVPAAPRPAMIRGLPVKPLSQNGREGL